MIQPALVQTTVRIIYSDGKVVTLQTPLSDIDSGAKCTDIEQVSRLFRNQTAAIMETLYASGIQELYRTATLPQPQGDDLVSCEVKKEIGQILTAHVAGHANCHLSSVTQSDNKLLVTHTVDGKAQQFEVCVKPVDGGKDCCENTDGENDCC